MPISQSNSPSQALINVLITAGPTQEPIDAVRYIGNRSSGQMGLALVSAAVARGWRVTLLLGPTPIDPPAHSNLLVVRFRTTAELQSLLATHLPHCDVLIMAAAVADFRPRPRDEQHSSVKLRRRSAGLSLELEPTPDLLAEAGAKAKPTQTMIGFALEPADELLASARDKLARKNLDFIVANPLETMGSPSVNATLIARGGSSSSSPGELTKAGFAEWLLASVERTIREKKAASS